MKTIANFIASAALLLNAGAQAAGVGAFPTETHITNAANVYSPAMIYQTINGQKKLVMYYGGWGESKQILDKNLSMVPTVFPQDSIYRVVCDAPNQCDTPQVVVTPDRFGTPGAGTVLVNDPSIVQLKAANGEEYLVMYMTGVPGTATGDPQKDCPVKPEVGSVTLACAAVVQDAGTGNKIENNKIYFSTSFANDGVNWSKPRLLPCVRLVVASKINYLKRSQS
jgi:hypothetical protein